MEIVIENPADSNPVITPTINSGFGTLPATNNRLYRTIPDMESSSSSSGGGNTTVPIGASYYGTLPLRNTRTHHGIPQMDFDVTTGRRVDKSGLLEIVEPDPSRCRPRHLTGAENPGHTGTLTRRIDRLGLLEAVPEVPDQLQDPKSPEFNTTIMKNSDDTRNRSITERHLTGAEIDLKDQPDFINNSLSPRASIVSIRQSIQSEDSQASTPSSVHGTQSLSSPYFHRGRLSPKPLIVPPNNTPVLINSNETTATTTTMDSRRGQLVSDVSLTNKFMSETIDSRGQPYVDLTGATYTRACANSPIVVSSRLSSTMEMSDSSKIDEVKDKHQPPDCLGRLSQKSKGDNRHSPLTVSSIPDVIEAHGSRVTSAALNNKTSDDALLPKGERAEAEGCEHTAIENLEEGRVSFKSSNNKIHNDNIQTLRVIILSEQL